MTTEERNKLMSSKGMPKLRPFTAENIIATHIKLSQYGDYSLSNVADFLSLSPSKILEVRDVLPEELKNQLRILGFDMDGLIERGLANDLDKHLANIEATERERCRTNWKEFLRKTK